MLSPERQSARMSKITNDCLTRSARHRMLYSCTYIATVDVARLIMQQISFEILVQAGLLRGRVEGVNLPKL